MFTGIIEHVGTIVGIEPYGSSKIFSVSSPLTAELKVDQSIAHNGVCLTIAEIEKHKNTYKVVVVEETLKRTTFNDLTIGDIVNLERSMPANGRFDGHLVQGHVDTTALCVEKENREGSWRYVFELPETSPLIVEKGSVCLNGISVTVFNVHDKKFEVAIIPYTYQHTNISLLTPGRRVNIEFDILGKYIQRLITFTR